MVTDGGVEKSNCWPSRVPVALSAAEEGGGTLPSFSNVALPGLVTSDSPGLSSVIQDLVAVILAYLLVVCLGIPPMLLLAPAHVH